MSEFADKKLFVSVAAMMSTATYGTGRMVPGVWLMSIRETFFAHSLVMLPAKMVDHAYNVARQRTSTKAVKWILVPDKVDEWENSVIITIIRREYFHQMHNNINYQGQIKVT